LHATRVLHAIERLALRPCILVFCYHRICPTGENPFYDPIESATPESFEFQIRFLRDHFRLPQPSECVEILATSQAVSEPTAVITFDDGYRDNFQHALPVLRSLETSALFFLPTAFVGQARLPWWDHVAYVVKHSQVARLVIEIPEPLDLDLNELPRHEALMAVIGAYLRAARPDDPAFLEHLGRRAEVDIDSARLAASLFMSWEEARALAAAGMGIGSHTHMHRKLASLSDTEQDAELRESKQILERELDRDVEAIAYPYGGRGDFTEDTKRLTKSARYRVAFALTRGISRAGCADPWAVPRVAVSASETNTLFRARADLFAAFGASIL
jgi:peptidoglycan/xylan/chitin deacetylase (PgdA/CDA1 family)